MTLAVLTRVPRGRPARAQCTPMASCSRGSVNLAREGGGGGGGGGVPLRPSWLA